MNEKDSVIKLSLLDAENDQLNTRIQLPDTILTGNYWLRAYTYEMLEGETSSICVSPIYVFGRAETNIAERPKAKNILKDTIPGITFYPEGGSIITGINSTVGLNTSMNNKPISVQGYLKDSRDSIIANFTTNQNGLGKFTFEPSGYRKYTVFLNWQGKNLSYPLPPFNYYSGQLSVSKDPFFYKLRVLLADSIYRKDFETYILGVSKDSLFFAAMGKGLCEIPIETQKIPHGIATFYLFDKGFHLLSERSVYVSENDLNIKLVTDKNVYDKREKISLSISVEDGNQQAIPADIAVSVIDTTFSLREKVDLTETAAGQLETDNLFSNSYRNLTDSDKELLLLNKKTAYVNNNGTIYKSSVIENDSVFNISGVVLNEKNIPSSKKLAFLISNTGQPIFAVDTTDDHGHFVFTIKEYADSTLFGISIKNSNGTTSNAKVLLDSFLYPAFKTPLSLKRSLLGDVQALNKHLNIIYESDEISNLYKTTLPNVTVKSYKSKADYDESKRLSIVSSILTQKDFGTKGGGMLIALMRVPGIQFSQGKVAILGPVMHGTEPILIVDGVDMKSLCVASPEIGEPSGVVAFLKQLDPENIDFIEILKAGDAAIYGMRGGNGVILVNTKTKRPGINTDEKLVKTFYRKGLSYPVIFPNLNYQLINEKEAKPKNIRSTLFWNGNLGVDATSKTITFYASDIAATYKVTITGITINGDIIYKTITFKVK